jgi:hypothetical protein
MTEDTKEIERYAIQQQNDCVSFSFFFFTVEVVYMQVSTRGINCSHTINSSQAVHTHFEIRALLVYVSEVCNQRTGIYSSCHDGQEGKKQL